MQRLSLKVPTIKDNKLNDSHEIKSEETHVLGFGSVYGPGIYIKLFWIC